MDLPTPNILYIAEVSANHLGSLDRAKEIIKSAAASGANAVKFQTYTADTMTLDLPQFSVSEKHDLWGGKNLYKLYEEAHTPWSWHSDLFELARRLGIIPFSSPFDLSALDFLENLKTPIYKIASLETGDFQLLDAIARTGKPVIMSTGATEWDELEEAVEVLRSGGTKDLTLLLCTSSYPAEPRDIHLRRMTKLSKSFQCKVGLSDHTLGIGTSIAAIALGATAIEKHLTLRREDGGPDGAFSMEPKEFSALVEQGNIAAEAIGKEDWTLIGSEQESRRLRRSLYIVNDVKKDQIVTIENVRSIRPAGGMKPKHLKEILGKKFTRDLLAGTPVTLEVIQKDE
jgi:pseudaminic acid synthase